jgi:hypothetical protein
MSAGNHGNTSTPLRLPDWWPEATGQVRFPTDDSLPTAAKALRGHLDQLGSAMDTLHAQGAVTAEDLGNWDAGQALTGTVKAAHEHISAVYRQFQRQLEAAAELLIRSHESHGAAEEASVRSVRRAGGVAPPHAPEGIPTQRTAPPMD